MCFPEDKRSVDHVCHFYKVSRNEWDDLMEKALRDEKHEFVRLFIDHGVVDLKDYLNRKKLFRDNWTERKEVWSNQ
jgi:hypothetical protein